MVVAAADAVPALVVVAKLKPVVVAGIGSFLSLLSVEVLGTDVEPKENPPLDSTFLLLSPTVPKLNNPGTGVAAVLPPNRLAVFAEEEGCVGAIAVSLEEASVAD